MIVETSSLSLNSLSESAVLIMCDHQYTRRPKCTQIE